MMRKKLYDISRDFSELQQLLNGEPEDEYIAQTLDAIKMELDKKAENIVNLLKNMNSPIETIDNEIKRLQERKKTIQNKTKQLERYLKNNMEFNNINKIETDLITIRLQNNPPKLIIDNASYIPADYVYIEQVTRTDDKRLKDDLKNGKEVPGVHLESGKHLRIK